MYIATNTMTATADEVITYLPHALRRFFYAIDLSEIFEIRLTVGRSVTLYGAHGRAFLSKDGTLSDEPYGCVRVNEAHIAEAMEIATHSSVYSAEDEIRNGFITLDGGHRIGICGSAVIREGKIAFQKDISSLSYRLAREVIGAADCVMDSIFPMGQVRSTLIISPPGSGKTTMLRDIARQLSQAGVRVCIADERREIAAMRSGRTSFDIGDSTTVLSGAPKTAAMLMMLRSMAPEVIITDEIGTAADAAAVSVMINSGTRLITSAHGSGVKQLRHRADMAAVMGYFEVFITLRSLEVREIITV